MNQNAELLTHLQQLCVEIGSRPIGSKGNHAAGAYIRDTFRAAGWEVEEQTFACRAWEHGETCLEIGRDRIEAAANAFSLACDVAAPTVAAGTVRELEVAEMGGRIGILYGDLMMEPLAAKSWFLKTDRDEHIVRLLESKRPAALVTIQPVTAYYAQGIEDWEFSIPSATVPYREGTALLRRSGERAHLRIASALSAGHSCNVVARRPGRGPARIALCAHYDTKIDTPGASDNGGGVAVLLALAQVFARQELAVGLELVAFTGEEYLPLGDDEYLRRCDNQLSDIRAAINFDGVGPFLGATSIMMAASSQEFHNEVMALTRQYPGVVWVPPWPESNHSTFSMRGVPSIALSAQGARHLAHHPADTVEMISPAKLAEAASLATDIVTSLCRGCQGEGNG